MEGLRHSLLAPAGGTVLILFSTVDALKRWVMTRYAAKDDDGKPLFPLPFAPWVPVDPKYEETAAKVLRAYRMFENVKEWTCLSLPLFWTFAIYGGSIPYVTDGMMDVATIGSALVFMIGNGMYASGYIESLNARVSAFAIRRRTFEFWLFGSVVSVVCGALKKYGVLE